jgi:GntR family transcriptional regulator
MKVQRNLPVAEQVFLELLHRIRSSQYADHQRLPSESDLAAEFQVSRSTIRTAMTKLESAGLVERIQGDGTYTRPQNLQQNTLKRAIWELSQIIEDQGHKATIHAISSDFRPSSPIEAEILQIKPGNPVFSAVRLFLADEDPTIVTFDVYPASLFKGKLAALDTTMLIHDFLKHYCGQEIAYANSTICAVIGDEQIQSLLQIDKCTPLMKFTDIFFNMIDEKPIVYSNCFLNTHDLSLHRVRPWG